MIFAWLRDRPILKDQLIEPKPALNASPSVEEATVSLVLFLHQQPCALGTVHDTQSREMPCGARR